MAKKPAAKAKPTDALKSAFANGDYIQAENLARSMVQKRPEDAFAWKRLGTAMLLQGRPEEALQPTLKSIELSPRDSETHNNLGVMLDHLGRKSEASESFRRAIELDPCYAEACNNLGNALMSLGEDIDAERWLKKAISLKPGYIEARNNLGVAYSMLGRHREAVDYFRRAISHNQDYAEAHFNLGNSLRELGQHADAVRSLEKAISLKPDYAEAYNSLGMTLYELGKSDRAGGCYLKAIELRPGDADCHYHLSTVCKADATRLASLEALLESARNDSARINLSFALAKACEDLEKYDDAFEHYSEGNRLKKKVIGYDIERDKALFDRIRTSFSDLREIPALSQQEIYPILIVGMPRSGTTLVEQILASHSEVHGAGELNTLNRLCYEHFVKSANADPKEICRIISSRYLEDLDPHGKRFVTDKMPANFQWLGFLLSALSGLRVVHVTRDPIAVCFSNFRQHFGNTGSGFSYDLSDLVEFYRLYEKLMEFWKERFPERIFELNYERLTENQEAETRSLLEYCGLDWDENCLEFEKNMRPVQTASSVQVRKGMYRGSSGAWRRYEKHLAPLLDAFGRK